MVEIWITMCSRGASHFPDCYSFYPRFFMCAHPCIHHDWMDCSEAPLWKMFLTEHLHGSQEYWPVSVWFHLLGTRGSTFL